MRRKECAEKLHGEKAAISADKMAQRKCAKYAAMFADEERIESARRMWRCPQI